MREFDGNANSTVQGDPRLQQSINNDWQQSMERSYNELMVDSSPAIQTPTTRSPPAQPAVVQATAGAPAPSPAPGPPGAEKSQAAQGSAQVLARSPFRVIPLLALFSLLLLPAAAASTITTTQHTSTFPAFNPKRGTREVYPFGTTFVL